ncbi:hypothetical protein [Photobacterium alginatilyticum]|uniref:Transcriptional regulator n=1 Tax=Photobacterium alginatilyticum TaxID=1775171 RepID=A0ABW9YQW9_9GAMM|nr:hypothetical protein [Photobacterium alginatilyticum]NBI56352.1 hypothetical protein [Photobacterium alginatilyticum]
MSKLSGPEASRLFSEYHELISAESDRGAVILSASILDATLEELLKGFLLDPVNKKDELFSGPYAPLGSFSAKIEMCYRLGIIKKEVRSKLNKFKAIRNDFAHRLDTARLDDEANRSRMLEILRCTPDIAQSINGIVFRCGLNVDENYEQNLLNGYGCRNTFDTLFSAICMALKRNSVSIDKIDCFVQEG